MGVGGQHHTRLLYPWESPGTHYTGGWVAPGPVWMGAKNLTPTRTQTPDRPAHNEHIYIPFLTR